MENLIESNERTLIIFDSVCSGLASCLSLVHADIKQMTEHRNKLALLEQVQIQANLLPPQALASGDSQGYDRPHNELNGQKSKTKKSSKVIKSSDDNGQINQYNPIKATSQDEDDPHHLSKLKLLDKRLADSFSYALSMNDLQKSSIHAKQEASRNRPSIFQVLLGKSGKTSNDSRSRRDNISGNDRHRSDDNQPIENKIIIDDINRQTRLAMQYAKQLEVHLLKVEDLRSKYEMHLKMGLVVKSVAKIYLNNGAPASTYGTHSGHNSPNGLARRHCSSLMVNDSSSLGTHSSVSSLNQSTWSSASRLKEKGHQQELAEPHTGGGSNNMYVSAISLNQKNHRRLSLARLISSAKNYHDDSHACSQQDETMATNGMLPRVSSHSHEHYSSSPYNYVSSTGISNMIGAAGKHCDNVAYGEIGNRLLSRSNANLNASQSSLNRHNRNRPKSQAGMSGGSKSTIKEFIENIDKIEAEFESYMGSFLLSIEDVQGFARVCSGDVFEITIKYGDAQKFKTRITVLKDNGQKCVNRQAVFKARIADILAIKAHECKGLGKRVLLGHKLCETRDLFTARSQLMTIGLNQSGSIKLNLIVTWNPLHLAPNSTSSVPGLDISHISLPATPMSSLTLSSTASSAPSINGTISKVNIQSRHHHNGNRHGDDPDDRRIMPDGHNEQQHPQNGLIYQSLDETYGYHIPPPDYLTSDVNY